MRVAAVVAQLLRVPLLVRRVSPIARIGFMRSTRIGSKSAMRQATSRVLHFPGTGRATPRPGPARTGRNVCHVRVGSSRPEGEEWLFVTHATEVPPFVCVVLAKRVRATA